MLRKDLQHYRPTPTFVITFRQPAQPGRRSFLAAWCRQESRLVVRVVASWSVDEVHRQCARTAVCDATFSSGNAAPVGARRSHQPGTSVNMQNMELAVTTEKVTSAVEHQKIIRRLLVHFLWNDISWAYSCPNAEAILSLAHSAVRMCLTSNPKHRDILLWHPNKITREGLKAHITATQIDKLVVSHLDNKGQEEVDNGSADDERTKQIGRRQSELCHKKQQHNDSWTAGPLLS